MLCSGGWTVKEEESKSPTVTDTTELETLPGDHRL